MRTLITILAVLSLTGCYDAYQDDLVESANVKCLNGVKYWVGTASYRGTMAVYINPETLTPERCYDN